VVQSTVYDVAAEAGVSTQTVSRVLNNYSKVSKDTRERVLAAIEKLHYEPNSLAQGLVTRRTKTIGVVVYDISNPFYGQLVRGVSDTAYAGGYEVIIGNSDADPKKDISYLRVFSRRRVDGILATIADPSTSHLGQWLHASCPVVFLDKFFRSESCSFVTVNNRRASCEAVEHLLSLGHRRIGILTASSTASDSIQERYEGYRVALQSQGVAEDPRLVAVSERQNQDGGERAMETLLRAGGMPTAVFCSNDAMAMGAMQAIYARGLRIPQDISVVGFDDVPVARLLRVPLTTVAQPIREMGSAAMGLLAERIQGGTSLPHRHIVLDARLVLRDSTAPARCAEEETQQDG